MMEETESATGKISGYTNFNHAMPTEVKCNVLQLALPMAVEDFGFGRQLLEFNILEYYRILSMLRLVCQEWNLIITKTPLFWTFISPQLPVDLRGRVLSLSTTCPVDIVCNFTDMGFDQERFMGLLERIKACPQKWKSLTLWSWRAREHLEVSRPILEHPAPNIQSLWIDFGTEILGLDTVRLFDGLGEQLWRLSLVRCPVSWTHLQLPNLETLNLEDLPVHVIPPLSKLLDIPESSQIRSLNLNKLDMQDDVGTGVMRHLSGLRLKWLGIYDLPKDTTNTLLTLLKREQLCPNFGIYWKASDAMGSTTRETLLMSSRGWLMDALANLPDQESGRKFYLEISQDASTHGYVDVSTRYGTRLDPYYFSLCIAHENTSAPIKLLRWMTDIVKQSGRSVIYGVASSVGLRWTGPDMRAIFDDLIVEKMELTDWVEPSDWAIQIEGVSVRRGYASFLHYLATRIEGGATPSWTLPSLSHLEINLKTLYLPLLRTVLQERYEKSKLISLEITGPVRQEDMEVLEELEKLLRYGEDFIRGLTVYDTRRETTLYPKKYRRPGLSEESWHSYSDDEFRDTEEGDSEVEGEMMDGSSEADDGEE